MPLCSGKMKGETQSLSGNIYLYPTWEGQCMHVIGGMDPSRAFVFSNNTCVNPTGQIYSGAFPVASAITKSNTFYVPGGTSSKSFPMSKGNWSAWQATGQDIGSVVHDTIPNSSVMVDWGRALLNIPPV
jgi:hypothetical protein